MVGRGRIARHHRRRTYWCCWPAPTSSLASSSPRSAPQGHGLCRAAGVLLMVNTESLLDRLRDLRFVAVLVLGPMSVSPPHRGDRAVGRRRRPAQATDVGRHAGHRRAIESAPHRQLGSAADLVEEVQVDMTNWRHDHRRQLELAAPPTWTTSSRSCVASGFDERTLPSPSAWYSAALVLLPPDHEDPAVLVRVSGPRSCRRRRSRTDCRALPEGLHRTLPGPDRTLAAAGRGLDITLGPPPSAPDPASPPAGARKVDPNQEMVGIGAANLGLAVRGPRCVDERVHARLWLSKSGAKLSMMEPVGAGTEGVPPSSSCRCANLSPRPTPAGVVIVACCCWPTWPATVALDVVVRPAVTW